MVAAANEVSGSLRPVVDADRRVGFLDDDLASLVSSHAAHALRHAVQVRRSDGALPTMTNRLDSAELSAVADWRIGQLLDR